VREAANSRRLKTAGRPACPRACAQPECASRAKTTDRRERAFFIRPQALEASSKNGLTYDGWSSGPIIYAYVGGDPISNIDPSGLKSVGQCAIEHNGLEDFFGDGDGAPDFPTGLAVRGVVGAGAIPLNKPWVQGSTYTNPWSKLGMKFPIKIPLGTNVIPGFTTPNLLRLVGRANLVLGVGLLAYDVASIGMCAAGD
jgi:hypothetical protein